ncbi:hypothetical protein E1B28_009882 [Marasmius oreades]|uniref:BAG domain-containing protein n=1 Tax=Marasmius oreades TaxID=181124 RepID=A0A9P7UQX7_9AGAR|nr:uncharacterized protein E1B28_009882 [Marasmius oreades]KAG7090798.1 hypothetical protein E1B28_009882 [Marasmius oreades]
MLSGLRNQHYYPYQPTSNLHGPRGLSSPLTPRDRLLASLAEAEAEFTASEAERFQRDEEELLLRRRLNEIQSERRFSYTDCVPRSSFENHSPLHRRYPHLEDFDYGTSPHDRLAALRLELQKEELRIARERKQARESEALRNKELREAERLTLLRKAEENRLELLRQQREQEEQKLLELRLAQRLVAEHNRSDTETARRPTVRYVVDSAPKELQHCQPPKRASCGSANSRNDLKDAQQVLHLLCGSQRKAAEEKRCKEAPMTTPEEFFNLLFGRSMQQERKSVTPSTGTGSGVLKVVKQQESVKPTSSSENTSKATASASSNLTPAEEFRKVLLEQKGAHTSSQDGKHVATPQDFFNMLFNASAPERSVTGESLNSTKSSTQQPTNTTIPNHPASPSNLRDQLEARLNNDEGTEIRDTIQAILASLADAATYKAEPVSGNSKPNPISSTLASSTDSPAESDSKGKGKVETSPTSSSEPTSNDVVKSMETVHTIQAAFAALQQDFVFPAQLDFTPTSSAAPSPVSSDTETSTPSILKLAYTSRNHPVRYYEQSLSGLLAQLDGVESFGNVEIRTMRKEVVTRVEGALDELEREVEGRWKARVARQERDKPALEDVTAAPGEGLEQSTTTEAGSTASPIHNAADESQTPSTLSTEEKAGSQSERAVVDVGQKEVEVPSKGNDAVHGGRHVEKSDELKDSPEVSSVEPEGVAGPVNGESEDIISHSVVASSDHDNGFESTSDVYSSTASDTQVPSLSSYPPSNDYILFYPPTSGVASTPVSVAASVATIRPCDLDKETTSTSSEEEDVEREQRGRDDESDTEGFLLSGASPTDDKKNKTQVEVQEEFGSDWSEVEA